MGHFQDKHDSELDTYNLCNKTIHSKLLFEPQMAFGNDEQSVDFEVEHFRSVELNSEIVQDKFQPTLNLLGNLALRYHRVDYHNQGITQFLTTQDMDNGHQLGSCLELSHHAVHHWVDKDLVLEKVHLHLLQVDQQLLDSR